MQLISTVNLKQFNYLHQLSDISRQTFRPDLRPIQSHIHWVLGLFFPLPGHQADDSPTIAAEVNKPYFYTSAPTYTLVAWCLIN
jgi:hypothetical protein